MKKQIQVTGINGTFTGEIEVQFNYTTKEKTVQIPVLHDEEVRRFKVHRVRVIAPANAMLSIKEVEFYDKQEAPKHAVAMENALKDYLHILADSDKTNTTIETLKSMGFTE